VEVEGLLQAAQAKSISGSVLTAENINSHNTFDKPDVVAPDTFKDVHLTEKGFAATLPPKSIVVLSID
jgi:alpha-N-arabinofuranosidase